MFLLGQSTRSTSAADASRSLYDLEALRAGVAVINLCYPLVHEGFQRSATVISAEIGALKSRLAAAGGSYALALRGWYAADARPDPEGLQAAKMMFGLSVTSADFDSPAVQHEVATWLAGSKIALPLGQATEYVVIARAAMHDAWQRPFRKEETSKGVFHGQSRDEDALYLTQLSDAVEDRRGLRVDLPLLGGLAFRVFEPRSGVLPAKPALRDFEGLYHAALAPCSLKLPKFSARTFAKTLLPSIQDGSLPDIPKIRVSIPPKFILQSASIDVTEGGVSTTSSTVIYAEKLSIRAKTCAIDRPFEFAIIDTTSNVMLVVGDVRDL
jgi:hypothetical protein